MKTNDATVVYSSEDPNWRTPALLYHALDCEFHFDVDLAADADSHLHPSHWFGRGGDAPDALGVYWHEYFIAGVGFLNPPYSREQRMPIDPWVKKAHEEASRDFTTVGLIPVRPDTRWWQAHVLKATEIRIIPHRVKFERPKSWRPKGCVACTPAALCLKHAKQRTNSAGFPTAVVVWRPQPGIIGPAPPRWLTWDYR